MSLARHSRLALVLATFACLVDACSQQHDLPPRASADAGAVTVGYQTLIDPGKVPQADARLRQALGGQVQWQLFSSGPAVVAALASGAIQIGHIGSVPLATALSRHLPIIVFMISSQTRGAEALVVRQSITAPAQLKGRLIATPFGSTAHYSLLNALQHWAVPAEQVRLVNLNPGDIAAAWRRGDIDGAYVWSPALSLLQQHGRTLVDSGQVARWGAPTFNVWVARAEYAQRHPQALRRFVHVLQQDYIAYNRDPGPWARAHAGEISRLTGVAAADVPAMLAGSLYPEAASQTSAELLGGGAASQTAVTARFLRQQNVIQSTLPDYRPGFSAAYIEAAAMAAETPTPPDALASRYPEASAP